MNAIEHLLTVLAEECCESAQRATKAIRFGLQEIQPGQSENNARRLEREVAEIVAVAELLGLKIREEDKAAKRAKLQEFMDYARTLGTLEKIPTQASMTEEEFVAHYGRIVQKAKQLLTQDNLTCGDNWPAGQDWSELSSSSKSIFMSRACHVLLIDRESYLAVVRAWPYSDQAMQKIDALFGQ